MITTQDTVAQFAVGDRVVIIDGGPLHQQLGEVRHIRVLPASIVYQVAVAGYHGLHTFSEWQLVLTPLLVPDSQIIEVWDEQPVVSLVPDRELFEAPAPRWFVDHHGKRLRDGVSVANAPYDATAPRSWPDWRYLPLPAANTK